MGVTYCYDSAKNRIETTCAGKVQFVDVVNHFHLLGVDAEIRPEADVLLDLTTMTSSPETFELETMNEALVRVATRRSLRRCAVLFDGDGSHDVAERFSDMAGAQFVSVRLFGDREEASAWLDAPTVAL